MTTHNPIEAMNTVGESLDQTTSLSVDSVVNNISALPVSELPVADASSWLSENIPVPLNGFSLSDNYVPTPPVEMKKFVELLADINLSNTDVDMAMGWEVGETGRKLKRWTMLRELKKESRLMAMREAGLSKADSYRTYVDALKADRAVVVDGAIEYVEDHDTRIKAADRVLTLMGEKPVGGGGTTVAVGVTVNLSQEERTLLDAYRRE